MSITAKIKSNDNITARIKSAERIVTTSAHYGLKGDTGATGATGAQGIQGVKGDTGSQGIQGIQGVKGDTGSQGIQGIQGANGGSSSHYHYLTKTTTFVGDPTATFIGWNNTTQIDSTALRISNTDQDSQDNNIFLNSVNVGDILVIQDRSNANNYQKWEITGAPTYNPTWDNFPVTKLATGGTGTTNFSNNYPVLLIIISVGAVGPQGIQGATGATGATGAQGIQGIQGVTGAAGAAGPGVAAGGATGTVLTKVSATNYDTTWTALGTAATRDVGRAAGNVLQLDQSGYVQLGSGNVAQGPGGIFLWDPDGEGTCSIVASDGLRFSDGLREITVSEIATFTDITATNLTGTVPVAKGGTGRTTATAYAPLFGGTTTTGAFQSGTVGTAGQVLTSNGASALPTFQSLGTAATRNVGQAATNLLELSATGTTTLGTAPAVGTVAEVSTFTFLSDPATWDQLYFTIGVPTGQAYVWFNKDGNHSDPDPAGFVRGIQIEPGEVSYGSAAANRTTYANTMVSVFGGDLNLSATRSGDVVTITSRLSGARTNITLGNLTGSDASVAVVTEGAGTAGTLGSVVLKSGNANADVSIKNIDGNIRFEKSSGNITLGNAAGTVALTSDLTTLSASNLTSGTVAAARMPALTGDITTSAGAVATTLATVNTNTGAFGSATAAPSFTVNAKGLITAASTNTITPAVGSITGLGTGVATALAVNLGTTGSPALRVISSDSRPALLNRMDEWYDSATGARFVNYDSQWVEVSGAAYPSNGSKAQDNPPTLPNVGDLWYDTSVGSLYVYLNGAWVEAQGNAIDSAGIIAALGYTPLANNGNISTLTGTGFFNVNGTIGATVPTTAAFTSVTSTAYTNIPGQTTVTSISAAGNTALSVFATDTIKTFIVPVSAGVSAFTATITLNVSAPVPQNGATTVVRVNLPASTNPRIQLRSNVTVIGEAIGNGIARTVTFRCNFDGSAWFIASRLPSTEKFLFTRPSAPAGSVWTSPYWSFTSPVGAREMTGYIIGSTGGGGSGARGAAGTHRCGGNGSDGASIGFTKSPYIVSNTPLRIQLGAGGVGGVAVTVDSTAGNPGTNGGQSLLNDQTTGGNGYNIINVNGSPLGRGGNLGSTPNAVNDTPSYLIYYYGTAGIRGASGATSGGGQSYTNAGPAGGAGGGLDTADTLRNGATGGRNVTWWIGYDNTGGVAPGGSGMNAISGIPPEMEAAGGAGGGASAIAVAGGNGGEGYKGGGAGGGGASTNGFNSGAGGNGSDAWAWLTFFY